MNTNADPLALYRISKQGAPSSFTPPDPFELEEENDPLSSFRVKPLESQEYTLKDIPRIGAGLAVRSAEIGVGAPGGLQKGIGTLLDYIIGWPAEKISGKKQPALRKFLKDPLSSLGKHREDIEELEKSSLIPGESSIFQNFPTSQDVKEQITNPASEYFTGEKEFLEPKTETERFAQEFTQDLTALALPGSGVQRWMSRIGLSLAGNTAKEVTKQLGYSPSTQELAKLATLGIVSLAQIGNAPQFARQYFQQTKSMMPRGVSFNATPLQNALNKIKNSDWYKGHSIPETRAAREMIAAIEKRIVNGRMNARQAMTERENINKLAKNLGAFEVDVGEKVTHVARLNEVRDALIEGMEQTLGRQYPKWWNTYQDANQVFGITQRSSALGDFIANNYARPVFSDAGKILFGNALAKGAAGIAKLGIAGAGIASGAKMISLTNRLARSETLRNYYSNVLRQAAAGDGVAMSEALRKFDEYSLKEEKEDKSRRVLMNRSRK